MLYLGPYCLVMAMRARMTAVLTRLPRPWLLNTSTTVRPRKFFRLLWLLARSLAELDACAQIQHLKEAVQYPSQQMGPCEGSCAWLSSFSLPELLRRWAAEGCYQAL